MGYYYQLVVRESFFQGGAVTGLGFLAGLEYSLEKRTAQGVESCFHLTGPCFRVAEWVPQVFVEIPADFC
jgi:hypothetical protein